MKSFLTIAQAAESAGVTRRTINYHIKKSKKLYPITVDGEILIFDKDLLELYPARPAGKKQFIQPQQKTKVGAVLSIAELITESAKNDNMVDVHALADALINI